MAKKEEEKQIEERDENPRTQEDAQDLGASSQIQGKDKESQLQESNVDVNEKLKQLESQYLRLMADYQNLQKRTAQEKEELYKFAGQRTIESLIPALDNFDYACNALTPEAGAEKLMKDFNLVFDSFLKALNEIGIETIEEVSIPFDPFYHEPLQQIHTDELPNHTVMKILKKGYMLNKKVIRPALVAVSVNPSGEQASFGERKESSDVLSEDKTHLGDG